MLVRQSLWLLAVSLTLALAEPIGIRKANGPKVNCDKIQDAVADAKKLGKLATVFCAAYLHIPTATTVLFTITPTTVVYTTVTATIRSSLCPAVEAPAPTKRALLDRRVLVPPGLAKYKVDVISSACSCLYFPPPEVVSATITASPTPDYNFHIAHYQLRQLCGEWHAL
ncbi:hypothetical protein QBC43DRAFT_292890 [Cladorrhinum sp. PSN259]|nr:hypothetical protein QBC43DRAFT_292890 [Cladorrhinum sp. PSN259]